MKIGMKKYNTVGKLLIVFTLSNGFFLRSESIPTEPILFPSSKIYQEALTRVQPPKPISFQDIDPTIFERSKQKWKGLNDLKTGYKTPELNEFYLKKLSKLFPSVLQYYRLGTSRLGKEIPAILMTISKNKNAPSILLECGIHANEITTPEYCYDVLHTILYRPKRFRHVLENFRIWIVPIVNVDGSHFFWRENLEMGRKNGYFHKTQSEFSMERGVDLNRNFPANFGNSKTKYSSPDPKSVYYRGEKALSEPESMAIWELAQKERFVFSLSFHARATAILFPYTIEEWENPNPSPSPYFAGIVAANAKSLREDKEYEAKKNIYPVEGTSNDALAYYFQTIALLVETSHLAVEYSYMNELLQGFRRSWMASFDELFLSPKVCLKVFKNKKPVEAKLEWDSIQYKNGEEILTNPQTGVHWQIVTSFEPHSGKIILQQTNEEKRFQIFPKIQFTCTTISF